MIQSPLRRWMACFLGGPCVLAPAQEAATEEARLVFPTLTTRPWYESGPPTTLIYFEPGSNTISVPGKEGRHVPRVSSDVETILLEAENLRAMGNYPQHEFCATPLGGR